MSDLREQFLDAKAKIMSRPVGGMPTAINALSDILRAANGNQSAEFNPEALSRHGIDPVEFRTAQAINFAKKTLDYHDNPGPNFIGVLVSRLGQCLDTSEEWALGRFLPDDLKKLAEDKLITNLPNLHSAGPKLAR